MASYRFCRSDDVPALVEAYNLCFRPHVADVPELNLERFKRLVREIDLWTSSCLLARTGEEPIGVLLATKREREALVWCVGVRPGFERQGHGRHLLTSLSQKLAILGPPRMIAEVPETWPGAVAFFEACDWQREEVYTDFVLVRPPRPPADESLIIPVTLDELLDNEVIGSGGARCWERSPETLGKRRQQISGLAVASPERIEAWLLYSDGSDGVRRILALDAVEAGRRELWLGLLCASACRAGEGRVVLERAHPREIDFPLLATWGFEAAGRTVAYVNEPTPA